MLKNKKKGSLMIMAALLYFDRLPGLNAGSEFSSGALCRSEQFAFELYTLYAPFSHYVLHSGNRVAAAANPGYHRCS